MSADNHHSISCFNLVSTKTVPIKIANKWARNLFNCNTEYILNVCKGRCCEGTGRTMVSLTEKEQRKYIKGGFDVKDGFLSPNFETGQCPNKLISGFCGVHDTSMQPFGCIASPFTLNKNGTLVLRYRYTKFKCYGNGLPAYKVFRKSLDLLFGKREAARICHILDTEKRDFIAKMPINNYKNLLYLDGLKRIFSERRGKEKK